MVALQNGSLYECVLALTGGPGKAFYNTVQGSLETAG